MTAIRRRVSRSEWAAKLLNLPCSAGIKAKPGLILLQIDGLAYRQFQAALAHNRLPFLRRLMTRGSHSLKQFYSGLPSTTPAVQGELFFGKKCAVPSFEFFDRKNGKRHVMFYPWSVDKIAENLSRYGEPLLKGGTSYSNIYAAGADEARYCVQTMNLESILRSINPLKLLILLILYFSKMVRTLGYALLELGLAVSDFLRGIAQKRNFFKELKFIFTRVSVCIILRELIRFRVKLDLKKGVRIIHANFVGYDEQAHRRGPDSAFAHWTLKGIDETIKDIYRSALRSGCRKYQLIVYSGHGQEKVRDYQKRFGLPLEKSVRKILAAGHIRLPAEAVDPDRSNHWNSIDRFSAHFRQKNEKGRPQQRLVDPRQIEITTMGPLGHIYLPPPLPSDLLEPLADLLVHQANIPLVLFVRNNRVYGLNSDGVYDLNGQENLILGADHPLLQEVARDLAEICRHPYAGDLVISGWMPHGTPMSFSIENGAHGGPGREETRGFILLPRSLPASGKTLRPLDLRRLVRNLFNDLPKSKASGAPMVKSLSLKVMSYNIHSCINVRRKVDPDGIIQVIAAYSPDIVALQEVDARKSRSNFIDQPKLLAERLEMQAEYFPLLRNGSEQFGLAILARHPIRKVKYEQLPALETGKPREVRGAMWIRVLTSGQPINFVNTHLGLYRRERFLQIRTLFSRLWGLGIPEDEPLIFCGDLNAVARSAVCHEVCVYLADVQQMVKQPGYPKATFFSRYPLLRIDHIFVSSHFSPRRVHVPDDPVTRRASDHLPVFAELEWTESGGA